MKKARKRKEFRAIEGSRISDKDAQAIGPELERLITARGGTVEAEDVVESATAATSPLHSYFEWDDAVAAKAHRLETARHLMRAVAIVHIDARGAESRVRGILRTNDGYTTTERVLESPDWTAGVLARMVSELDALKRRYETWKSLPEVQARLVELGKLAESWKEAKAA